MEVEKKMRIQYLTKEGIITSDRLVTQDPEFNKGPKELPDGPVRIEFSLFEKEDTEKCITYLQQLSGKLPVEVRKKRGSKKLSKGGDYREELKEFIKGSENMGEFVKGLRNLGFKVSHPDYLKDLGLPINISSADAVRYKWMVKVLRVAKNPLNTKYDTSLLVGIRKNKVIVNELGEITLEHPLKGDASNQVKVPVKFKVKFPEFMTPDERNSFRISMDNLLKDPSTKIPRNYSRYVSNVVRESPLEIEFPCLDRIPDPYNEGFTVAETREKLIRIKAKSRKHT
jgi:hypothetical protein